MGAVIEFPQNFYFSATFYVFTDGTERRDRTTENGTERWDRKVGQKGGTERPGQKGGTERLRTKFTNYL